MRTRLLAVPNRPPSAASGESTACVRSCVVLSALVAAVLGASRFCPRPGSQGEESDEEDEEAYDNDGTTGEVYEITDDDSEEEEEEEEEEESNKPAMTSLSSSSSSSVVGTKRTAIDLAGGSGAESDEGGAHQPTMKKQKPILGGAVH